MSLYNMLFGQNPLAPLLMAALGNPDVGRYRDAYLDGDRIVVHTRNGGGNRDCYCDDPFFKSEETEPRERGHKPGCLALTNEKLSEHPLYVSDADDDFDCTYADFVFRFPPEHADALAELSRMQGEPNRPAERWQELLAKLADPSTPKDDPDLVNAKRVGEQIIPPILDALGNSTSVSPTLER